MQHNGNDDMTYDLDKESFVLEFFKIPNQSNIYDLSQEMLRETRLIEKNLIQKLNCMYFAARKISLPSIEFMMKKEQEMEDEEEDSSKEMYIEFS